MPSCPPSPRSRSPVAARRAIERRLTLAESTRRFARHVRSSAPCVAAARAGGGRAAVRLRREPVPRGLASRRRSRRAAGLARARGVLGRRRHRPPGRRHAALRPLARHPPAAGLGRGRGRRVRARGPRRRHGRRERRAPRPAPRRPPRRATASRTWTRSRSSPAAPPRRPPSRRRARRASRAPARAAAARPRSPVEFHNQGWCNSTLACRPPVGTRPRARVAAHARAGTRGRPGLAARAARGAPPGVRVSSSTGARRASRLGPPGSGSPCSCSARSAAACVCGCGVVARARPAPVPSAR